MRHLIACASCRRQVDATGQRVGSRFACTCGATLVVHSPKPHDAAVVRCSSCGASRAGGEPTCTWCGSEFTLHERDLHTICPQCATRIGDRARHCHACGVAIAPQPPGVADPTRTCPACPAPAPGPGGSAANPLAGRSLAGNGTLLECGRCAGVWMEPHELRELVARVVAASPVPLAELGLPTRSPATRGPADPSGAPAGPLYRPCVRCGQRMNRTRFAGRTPVVVDYCKDHGVWFDAEELGLALQAVRDGRSDRRSSTQGGTGTGGVALPGDQTEARRQERAARERAWRAEGRLPRDTFDVGTSLGQAAGEVLLQAVLHLFR